MYENKIKECNLIRFDVPSGFSLEGQIRIRFSCDSDQYPVSSCGSDPDQMFFWRVGSGYGHPGPQL